MLLFINRITCWFKYFLFHCSAKGPSHKSANIAKCFYNHIILRSQQFIPIIAILCLSGCKLCCELPLQFYNTFGIAIQHTDNFTLNFKGWNGQNNIHKRIWCHFNDLCSMRQLTLLCKKHL